MDDKLVSYPKRNNNSNYIVRDKDGVYLNIPITAIINNKVIDILNFYNLPYTYDMNYCYIDESGGIGVAGIEPEYIDSPSIGIGFYLDFQNNLEDKFGNIWNLSYIKGNTDHLSIYKNHNTLYLDAMTKHISTYIPSPTIDMIEHISFCYTIPWTIDFYFRKNYTDFTNQDIILINNSSGSNYGSVYLLYMFNILYFYSSYYGNKWDVQNIIGSLTEDWNYIHIYYDGNHIYVTLNNYTVNIPGSVPPGSFQYVDTIILGTSTDYQISAYNVYYTEFCFTPYYREKQLVYDFPQKTLDEVTYTYGKSFSSLLSSKNTSDAYNLRWHNYGTVFTNDGILFKAGNFMVCTNYPLASEHETWRFSIDITLTGGYGYIVNYANLFIIFVSNNNILSLIINGNVTDILLIIYNTKYTFEVVFSGSYRTYINNTYIKCITGTPNINPNPVLVLGRSSFSGYLDNISFIPSSKNLSIYKDVYVRSLKSWMRIGSNLDFNILYIGSYNNYSINHYYGIDYVDNRSYPLDFYNNIKALPLTFSINIKLFTIKTVAMMADYNGFVYVIDSNGYHKCIYSGKSIDWVDIDVYNDSRLIIDSGDLYIFGSNSYAQLGGDFPMQSYLKFTMLQRIQGRPWNKTYTFLDTIYSDVGTDRQLFVSGTATRNVSITNDSPYLFKTCCYSNSEVVYNADKLVYSTGYYAILSEGCVYYSKEQGFTKILISNIVDIATNGSTALYGLDDLGSLYLIYGAYGGSNFSVYPSKIFNMNINRIFGSPQWLIVTSNEGNNYILLDTTAEVDIPSRINSTSAIEKFARIEIYNGIKSVSTDPNAYYITDTLSNIYMYSSTYQKILSIG